MIYMFIALSTIFMAFISTLVVIVVFGNVGKSGKGIDTEIGGSVFTDSNNYVNKNSDNLNAVKNEGTNDGNIASINGDGNILINDFHYTVNCCCESKDCNCPPVKESNHGVNIITSLPHWNRDPGNWEHYVGPKEERHWPPYYNWYYENPTVLPEYRHSNNSDVTFTSHNSGLTEGDQYYTTIVKEECCEPEGVSPVPIPNSMFLLCTGIASIVGVAKF